MSYNKRFFLYLLILILFIALVAGLKNKSIKSQEKLQNTYIVELSTIEDSITLTGTIHPKNETYIMPYHNGYIKKLYVKQGDFVKKNDPLVKIDKTMIFDENVNPIRAPYSGTITLINKTLSQYVTSGDYLQDFILKLEDSTEMYLHANASENDIIKITKSQAATIKVTPILNNVYEGIVSEFALSTKTERTNWGNSKTVFPVKIKIVNPDDSLRSGMNAIADIIVQKKENVISIPNEYLHQDQKKDYVLMKDDSKRFVKIGIMGHLVCEIIEGLAIGEEIQMVNYFETKN